MTNKGLAELAHLAQIELAKRQCLTSTLFNAQYFFEKIKKETFIVNPHHKIIGDALDKVFRGDITRLIINIAPRYTKTELAVKTFAAKGLAHNPKAKFIHLSYSDTLALDNSDSIREVCKNINYQTLFPHVQISKNSDSKKKWYTTQGGGIYATAAAGQVTGFGAGAVEGASDAGGADRVIDEDMEIFSAIEELDATYINQIDEGIWRDPYANFAGAILIDDPIKPEDALSDVKRGRINDRFDSTIRNRVNSKKTPIIVCHQRVHPMDLTGHLLEIEPEEWTVIKLPCLQEDGTPLWELKHNRGELMHLKKINLYVFESQYQQDPKPVKRGGEFYKLFNYANNVIKNPMGPLGKPILYDPKMPLHVTLDFNVQPYMALGIWQVWGKKAIKIDEVKAVSPSNNTEGACKGVIRKYPGHEGGMFIYGDPNGRKEDTRSEKGQNDFTIARRVLAAYRPSMRELSSAPPVKMRGDFINTLFISGFDGVTIWIGDNCVKSIEDFQNTKEKSDGTKLKENAIDELSGISSQKYGHFSDGDDYFICRCFNGEFARYQKGGVGGKTTTGRNVSKSSY